MAAKKSTAKKSTNKAAVKNTTSKKVNKKTAAAKKSTVSKKAAVKKDTTVDSKTKHVSETVTKSNKNNIWVIGSVVLAILILVLVAYVGFIYFGNNGNSSSVDSGSLTSLFASDNVTLVVIEDPSCADCQVDLFAQQVKDNLFTDMVISKYSYDSDIGKQFVEMLNVKMVPVYLFSDKITLRDDWSQLVSAFNKIEIADNVSVYMLNPSLVGNKVMIGNPEILEGAAIIGDVNAPVTVYEFTDFECPYCAIAEGNPELVEQFSAQYPGYQAPIPSIMNEYVESGKVKIVFYNYPIPSLHPLSITSHLAAMCANEQGKFNEYSDVLWEKRSEWTAQSDRPTILKQYATDLGLDKTQFDECLDSAKYQSQIEAEQALGQSYGISGTPAFFVGNTFISGAQDYSTFKSLIDAQLAEQE